ncbi:hypothetical protein [Bosea lupini]|uniref:hypothetical protein n=1 Tax=Bosea lupini TaxID=1036779 RepID=UPI001160314A|nr:hypothetical protein [Bosea lupini]
MTAITLISGAMSWNSQTTEQLGKKSSARSPIRPEENLTNRPHFEMRIAVENEAGAVVYQASLLFNEETGKQCLQSLPRLTVFR